MDLDSLFDNFESVAFRLETLPFFASDTRKPGFQTYLDTGKLPADHNAPWRQEVRDGTLRGRSYHRLRLFSSPLTDYERYERDVYALSIEAGEVIRAVFRSEHEVGADFWLFDNSWIAYMEYDSEGEFLGTQVHEVSDSEKGMTSKWIRIFEQEAKDPQTFS